MTRVNLLIVLVVVIFAGIDPAQAKSKRQSRTRGGPVDRLAHPARRSRHVQSVKRIRSPTSRRVRQFIVTSLEKIASE